LNHAKESKGLNSMAENEVTCDHGDKMCALTCCPCHLDVEKLKPLVRSPQFICKSCGRVAASEKHLCDPASLI
jgi:hypothetical protein